MSDFDPRGSLSPSRHAPAVVGCAAVLMAAGGGVLVASTTSGVAPGGPAALAPAALAALEPATPPPAAVALTIRVSRGETLTAAVQRTGVAAEEARQVVSLLSQAFDTVHIRAGMAFRALVARPHAEAPPQLVGLEVSPDPTSQVRLARAPQGDLRLHEAAEPVRDETHVAAGVMRGSLYESALRAGATPTLVAEATRLFAKKLDFARDIQPGDGFRLAFDRKVAPGGRTVATGDLLYAEIGAKGRTTRFYRFEHGGRTEFLDEIGQQLKALLLRTPLEGAHMTSSFGMRLHPLLGFNRLHPGVDFGAPAGAPVFAAGDGVVEEARWAGGYGRWLKLQHGQGYETGYGHLSRFAAGVRPGVRVRQGQVVAYVGSTGLSTGPHLHYEVVQGGRRTDPRRATIPQGAAIDDAEVAAFHAQKARINALLAHAAGPVRTAALRTATLR